MLNRPAFFALLGAAGIAVVGYGCQLEEREPPAPNPRPGGATPAAQGAGPTGSGGGGGAGGEGQTTTATTTTGGDGGGGGNGSAELLFPFCGCLEAGADDMSECWACLWFSGNNMCLDEDDNCQLSQNGCVTLFESFRDGICPTVDEMCISIAIDGLEPFVPDFAEYLSCACGACTDVCPASACQ